MIITDQVDLFRTLNNNQFLTNLASLIFAAIKAMAHGASTMKKRILPSLIKHSHDKPDPFPDNETTFLELGFIEYEARKYESIAHYQHGEEESCVNDDSNDSLRSSQENLLARSDTRQASLSPHSSRKTGTLSLSSPRKARHSWNKKSAIQQVINRKLVDKSAPSEASALYNDSEYWQDPDNEWDDLQFVDETQYSLPMEEFAEWQDDPFEGDFGDQDTLEKNDSDQNTLESDEDLHVWVEQEFPDYTDTRPILEKSLHLEDKARLRAIQFIEEFDWSLGQLDFLTVLLTTRGYGSTIKAIERLASRGMLPEELLLASNVMSLWKQSSHLWIRIQHNGSVAAYCNISWVDSLRLIRVHSGPTNTLPSLEEVEQTLDTLHEQWFTSPHLTLVYTAFYKFFSSWLFEATEHDFQTIIPDGFGLPGPDDSAPYDEWYTNLVAHNTVAW